jgi:hypothetical protein
MKGMRTADALSARPLLITAIPAFGLTELQNAIDAAIYWNRHHPVTREDFEAREAAHVCLMQSRWHVAEAAKAVAA